MKELYGKSNFPIPYNAVPRYIRFPESFINVKDEIQDHVTAETIPNDRTPVALVKMSGTDIHIPYLRSTIVELLGQRSDAKTQDELIRQHLSSEGLKNFLDLHDSKKVISVYDKSQVIYVTGKAFHEALATQRKLYRETMEQKNMTVGAEEKKEDSQLPFAETRWSPTLLAQQATLTTAIAPTNVIPEDNKNNQTSGAAKKIN